MTIPQLFENWQKRKIEAAQAWLALNGYDSDKDWTGYCERRDAWCTAKQVLAVAYSVLDEAILKEAGLEKAKGWV